MSVTSAAEYLRAWRERLAKEIVALDHALAMLGEGLPEQPVHALPPAKDASTAPSLPVRTIPGVPTDPAFKAEVVAYAEKEGTRSAVDHYGVNQTTVDKWRRLAHPKAKRTYPSRATGERAAGHDSFIPGQAAKERIARNGTPPTRSEEAAIRDIGRTSPVITGPAKPTKSGPVEGFTKAPGSSVLSDLDKQHIVDYAQANGLKAAANFFSVSQERVADLQEQARRGSFVGQ